jgi:hypothetical protein
MMKAFVRSFVRHAQGAISPERKNTRSNIQIMNETEYISLGELLKKKKIFTHCLPLIFILPMPLVFLVSLCLIFALMLSWHICLPHRANARTNARIGF